MLGPINPNNNITRQEGVTDVSKDTLENTKNTSARPVTNRSTGAQLSAAHQVIPSLTSTGIEESAFVNEANENLAKLETNLIKVSSDRKWLSKLTEKNQNIPDTQRSTILTFLILREKMKKMIESAPGRLLIDDKKIPEATAKELVQIFINAPLPVALKSETPIKTISGQITEKIDKIESPVQQLACLVRIYQDYSCSMYNESVFRNLSKITSPEELVSSLEKNHTKRFEEYLDELKKSSNNSKDFKNFNNLTDRLNKFKIQAISSIQLKRTQFNALVKTLITQKVPNGFRSDLDSYITQELSRQIKSIKNQAEKNQNTENINPLDNTASSLLLNKISKELCSKFIGLPQGYFKEATNAGFTPQKVSQSIEENLSEKFKLHLSNICVEQGLPQYLVPQQIDFFPKGAPDDYWGKLIKLWEMSLQNEQLKPQELNILRENSNQQSSDAKPSGENFLNTGINNGYLESEGFNPLHIGNYAANRFRAGLQMLAANSTGMIIIHPNRVGFIDTALKTDAIILKMNPKTKEVGILQIDCKASENSLKAAKQNPSVLRFMPSGPLINKDGEYALATQMEQAFSNQFKALPEAPINFKLLENPNIALKSSKGFFQIQDTTEGRKFEKDIHDALSSKLNN